MKQVFHHETIFMMSYFSNFEFAMLFYQVMDWPCSSTADRLFYFIFQNKNHTKEV